MAERRVFFQRTPNPNAAKFVVPGERIIEGGARTFASREEASEHPLARELLALDGVASVFMVNDFVTVTKSPAAAWEALAPRVEEVVRRLT